MTISPVGAVGGFTPLVPQNLTTTATQVGQTAQAGQSGMAAGTQATPAVDPTAAIQGTGATTGVSGAGSDFGNLLSQGLSQLQGLQNQTDQLAVKAATGDLNAIHDYTITATEASVATQLTTAVRNKALEAFQQIMQMQV